MPIIFPKWARNFLIFGSITIGVILLFLLALGSYHRTPEQPRKISLTAKPEATVPVPSTLTLPAFAAPLPTSMNTTKNLSVQIAREFVRLNPHGPRLSAGGSGIAAPDAEKLVNDFLAQGIKDFDYEKLKPVIQDSDIRIIDTEDPEIFTAYIKKFLTVFNHIPSRLPTTSDIDALNTFISIYNGFINDFYALEVPRPLVPIHKAELATVVANRRIFEIVRNYEQDPLRAMLALGAADTLKNEFAAIYGQLGDFIAAHRLTITL